MTFWANLENRHGIQRRDTPPALLPGVTPPRRTGAGIVDADSALTLGPVYRAVQVLATSGLQLTGDQYRGADRITEDALALRPDPFVPREHLIAQTIVDLATCGNAYWRDRMLDGKRVGIRQIPPHEVTVVEDPITRAVQYWHLGQEVPVSQMRHMQLLRMTGRPYGLGPIQAAAVELGGALDSRDYGSKWLRETDIPSGVLTTTQIIDKKTAAEARQMWTGDGQELTEGEQRAGHRIRVMGAGLSYSPILLKPADVQFLESRQFDKTGIATLFGMPAAMLLAAVDGGSKTYTNMQQDLIWFVRFTLMAYLREIEIAVSELLPRGHVWRFNLEGFYRTDTKTRYEAHAIAFGRWKTADEIRAIEGDAPLTAEQRAELATTNPSPVPSSALEDSNA